jgi:hypothetical protein
MWDLERSVKPKSASATTRQYGSTEAGRLTVLIRDMFSNAFRVAYARCHGSSVLRYRAFPPFLFGVTGREAQPRQMTAARGIGSETKRAIMSLVADGRTRRMHTVPEGYFEAFAVQEPARRTSRVWRFDRSTRESKLLGVRDAEIAKDIYTVFNDDGTPDTGIESELLCGFEGAFCTARNLLVNQKPLSKENWSSLFRFVAAQLLRTPRFFQLMRDGLAADGHSV